MSLYLVMTELWVHNEHMAGSPQPAILVSPIAEVTVVGVVGCLHRDQSKEPPVVGTTGAEGEFLCRIGGQNLTSVTAQAHTVMHDLGGERQLDNHSEQASYY